MNAQDRDAIERLTKALERIAIALEEKPPTLDVSSVMGPVHLARPITDARARTARPVDL